MNVACKCSLGVCLFEKMKDVQVLCRMNEQLNSIKAYVIVCKDRTKKSDVLVFWNPNRAGYTEDLERAGSYNREEVEDICSSGLHEYYLRSTLNSSNAKKSVIDRDYLYREISEFGESELP